MSRDQAPEVFLPFYPAGTGGFSFQPHWGGPVRPGGLSVRLTKHGVSQEANHFYEQTPRPFR